MKKNKKAFIFLIISVVTVLVVGTVATTYAWFLSRYSKEYEFVLESMSPVIIKYETQLDFASGTQSTAGNTLVPATAKTLVGISQGALEPMNMFDVDTVTPEHTGVVKTAAHAVSFVADGAYWTGEAETVGLFLPELRAYTGTFLSSSALVTHLGTFSNQTSITEENLLTLLTLEEDEYTAASGNRMIARNDRVAQGEVDYAMVIEYLGETILYYDEDFYLISDSEGEGKFELPASLEPDDELRYWQKLQALDGNRYTGVYGAEHITDGTYLRLMPNTTFSFTMYVFMAKTDEELDPAINGETLSLFASLTVVEETQQGGNS